MTSAVGKAVLDTGEVRGAVKRTNTFEADTFYTYNSGKVGFALNSQVVGQNATITMVPDDTISNTPSSRYAKRHYDFATSIPAGPNFTSVGLVYTDAELQNSVKEAKLGVRSYNGSNWSKVAGTGYARNVDTTVNSVLVTGVSAPIAGVTELGLVNVAFQTKVDNALWAAGTTWDEGSKPGVDDDAEVNNTNISVDATDSVASVSLLTATSSLAMTTGDLKVLSTLDNAGTLSVATGHRLDVLSHLTNNKDITVSTGATLAIQGKLRNFGQVVNDGVIDIGQ